MIPYSKQQITQEDEEAVLEVLRSDWIAGNGPKTKEFEVALADYTSYKYAIAVNSATSGLLVAYLSVLGDRVSVPALTFVATANMVLAANKKLSIRNINPKTLTSEDDDVAVSYAGYPVGLGKVADDAHYLYPGMGLWKKNLVSVLSFHPVKPITTGEGGAILTNHQGIYENCRELTDHGRSEVGFGFGYNFRMSDIQAALGLSQLKRASDNLRRRQYIAAYYRLCLAKYDEIELPPYHMAHAYHLFVIRVRNGLNRDWLRSELAEKGIGTQIHYPPLHKYYLGNTVCPATMDVWTNGLSIPLYSSMTDGEVLKVVEAIKNIIQRYRNK